MLTRARRWLYGLHGGQFAMLIGAVLVLIVVVARASVTARAVSELAAVAADRSYYQYWRGYYQAGRGEEANKERGASLAAIERSEARRAIVLQGVAVGLAVALIPTVWSWFGVRRRGGEGIRDG